VFLQLVQQGACPIGIDVAPGGLRALQLRRGRSGYSVHAAARVDHDLKTLELPWRERVEASLPLLQRRIDDGGFSGRKAVLTIDDDILRVRSVRQPRMPRDEADKALRLEAPERLGFESPDEAELDWIRAGEVRQGDDLRDELILVGAPTPDVEWTVNSFIESGLKPVAVEPRFVASGRCFSRRHRRASDGAVVRLLVEIGWRRSNVIVLRGADILFYKTFEEGGAEMNRAAAERLEMDETATLELRRQRMAGAGDETVHDPRVDRAIYDAIRPILGEVATEIGRCLRYYTVTFRGGRPDFALVVGPEAREPGLTGLLAEALNTEVHVGRPLDEIDTAAGAAAFDRRSELSDWAVAMGLSLRADAAADAGMRRRRKDDPERDESDRADAKEAA